MKRHNQDMLSDVVTHIPTQDILHREYIRNSLRIVLPTYEFVSHQTSNENTFIFVIAMNFTIITTYVNILSNR